MSSTTSSNPIFIDLTRLLHRLNEKLGDVNDAPRPSGPELSMLTTNLNYGRKLLLQLENEASAIKNQIQRQRTQAELMQQRHVVRKLNETLHELERRDDPTVVVVDDVTESPAETHVQPLQIPPPNAAASYESPPPPPQQQNQAPNAPAALQIPEPTSVMRNRFSKPAADKAKSTATPSATTTDPNLEKSLTHQQREQDNLTSSLLQMARQLKSNSEAFGENLESEKSYLDDATKGLDKNVEGMQRAGGKMNQLEKGQGVTFFYQIKVFAALAILAMTGLLMLYLPKLRF